MTTKEKTAKKYKITVTQHYWVKKESVNYVDGDIAVAMKQVEQDYEDEVLSWDTVSKNHEGVDWGIETLGEDESTDE